MTAFELKCDNQNKFNSYNFIGIILLFITTIYIFKYINHNLENFAPAHSGSTAPVHSGSYDSDIDGDGNPAQNDEKKSSGSNTSSISIGIVCCLSLIISSCVFIKNRRNE